MADFKTYADLINEENNQRRLGRFNDQGNYPLDKTDAYDNPIFANTPMPEKIPQSEAILPQPSLIDKSPLAMPNFANAQRGTGIDFVNELFKNTPAYDPRVAPMAPDQMDMDAMTIESQVPKSEQLKQSLQKFQELRKPQSVESVSPVISPKQEPAAKPDDLYLQQGVSKMIQGLSRMGGGQIDDNADFYNQYRRYQLEKPQQELENKIKQRNYDRMLKMDDPNSSESKNFRKALESMSYGQELKRLYGSDWEKVSANDKDTIYDVIRTKENIEAKKEQARILSQQRSDNLEEKKREFELKMADKKEQAARLTPKQISDVTALDNALGMINNIQAEKSKFDTGPVSSRQNALAQMFGMDDAQKSKFKADVQSNVAEYIKSISGAAVSDQERAFLLQNMPTMTDNDATFSAKLQLVKERLERNRNNYLTNMNKSGKNIKEYQDTSTLTKSDNKTLQNKPKTVTQNGHTYTLDEATGEYK